jgi:hypothetical protein
MIQIELNRSFAKRKIFHRKSVFLSKVVEAGERLEELHCMAWVFMLFLSAIAYLFD